MSRPSNMYRVTNLSGEEALWLPNPDMGSGENLISTLVNSARNAEAIVTAQKVGRDQDKTTLAWNYLDKDVWEKLISFWDRNFFFKFTYYSRVTQSFITRECYISDRKDKPFQIDANGVPTAYKDCSASIVDTGKGV